MRRLLFYLGVLSLVLAACGAPATEMPAPPEQEGLLANSPVPPSATATQVTLPTPTLRAALASPTASTSAPAVTPTETLLPPLELPTLAANPPVLAVWDGQPTYLGDSQPGYYFRLHYDPEVWALVTDQYGQPALGHRLIQYCTISPIGGRGLPPNIQTDHEITYVGNLTIDTGRAYENGTLVFVTYQVSDHIIFTGFEVDFKEESDACVKDAGAVITTLQSIPISRATPLVTPQP